MSNIPFNAIGAAFSPVQRSNNELVRARKVQSDKNSHHTEDVEELDETAVQGVTDQQQHGNDRQKGRNRRSPTGAPDEDPEEKVEITSLPDLTAKPTPRPLPIPPKRIPPKPRSSLDISA